ncbi:MAG: cell division protein ZipA C-terminal FtsZ-binding domain-containing protein, partial [Methylobacter sp.]
NRLVDFGVACIVEPGTFPEKDLDTFYCPGIVFFMQPEALDDPQAVFDDYIETINLLAAKLDGVILDHRRQPLTEATVQAIRQSL